MKSCKKKSYKIIRFIGNKKNNRENFLEFGWVENSTFNNNIYILIHSAHKDGDMYWELRTDEALLFIQGLSKVIYERLS